MIFFLNCSVPHIPPQVHLSTFMEIIIIVWTHFLMDEQVFLVIVSCLGILVLMYFLNIWLSKRYRGWYESQYIEYYVYVVYDM